MAEIQAFLSLVKERAQLFFREQTSLSKVRQGPLNLCSVVPTPNKMHPEKHTLNYRPDIDGLRAIAVIAVVGFHSFPGWVRGGFIGVDVFFVISGFLISRIIFENLSLNRFEYMDFYARRVRRIFPALIVVLAFCLSYGWIAMLPVEYAKLGKHVVGGATFVSNFMLWSESGYFDVVAEQKPLLHLWSLGIEEQFYIFWPLLLGFVWKRKKSFLRTQQINSRNRFEDGRICP